MESTKSSTGKFVPCFMDNFTEPTSEQIEWERLNEIAEEYGMYGVSDVWKFNELKEKYNRSRGHLRNKTPGSALDYFPMYVQYCILSHASEVPKKYTREPFSRIVDELIDMIILVCRDEHHSLEEMDLSDDEVIRAYICPLYIIIGAAYLIDERTEEE